MQVGLFALAAAGRTLAELRDPDAALQLRGLIFAGMPSLEAAVAGACPAAQLKLRMRALSAILEPVICALAKAPDASAPTVSSGCCQLPPCCTEISLSLRLTGGDVVGCCYATVHESQSPDASASGSNRLKDSVVSD